MKKRVWGVFEVEEWTKVIARFEMFFYFNKVENCFCKIVENWLQKCELEGKVKNIHEDRK